jgi:hypothetical protein
VLSISYQFSHKHNEGASNNSHDGWHADPRHAHQQLGQYKS